MKEYKDEILLQFFKKIHFWTDKKQSGVQNALTYSRS